MATQSLKPNESRWQFIAPKPPQIVMSVLRSSALVRKISDSPHLLRTHRRGVTHVMVMRAEMIESIRDQRHSNPMYPRVQASRQRYIEAVTPTPTEVPPVDFDSYGIRDRPEEAK